MTYGIFFSKGNAKKTKSNKEDWDKLRKTNIHAMKTILWMHHSHRALRQWEREKKRSWGERKKKKGYVDVGV